MRMAARRHEPQLVESFPWRLDGAATLGVRLRRNRSTALEQRRRRHCPHDVRRLECERHGVQWPKTPSLKNENRVAYAPLDAPGDANRPTSPRDMLASTPRRSDFGIVSVILLAGSRVASSAHDSKSIRMTCVVARMSGSTELRENLRSEPSAEQRIEIVSKLQISIDVPTPCPLRPPRGDLPKQSPYVTALMGLAEM